MLVTSSPEVVSFFPRLNGQIDALKSVFIHQAAGGRGKEVKKER